MWLLQQKIVFYGNKMCINNNLIGKIMFECITFKMKNYLLLIYNQLCYEKSFISCIFTLCIA